MFNPNPPNTHVRSYEDAVQYWETRVPWRGASETEERPLRRKRLDGPGFDGTTSKNYGVRRAGDWVIFRHHYTDVVTWKSPDEVDLQLFESVTTANFINGILPTDVCVQKLCTVIEIGYDRRDRVSYPTAGREHVTLRRVDGHWVPHYRTDAWFSRIYTDREAAKEALSGTGYAAYRDYHKIMSDMQIQPAWDHSDPELYGLFGSKLVNILADTDNHPRLYLAGYSPDRVRKLLYEAHGAVVRTEYLPTYTGSTTPNIIYGKSHSYPVMPSA